MAASGKKQNGQDFAARQKEFNESLSSGDYRRVYLISGEQAYLRLQNRNKLVKALLGDGDEMNLNRYSGTDVDAGELIDMAETLPFFADRRVLVLEGTCLMNPKAGGRASSALTQEAEKLSAYLPRIPESTSIVFVEESVDKRGRLYKAVTKCVKEENGWILECATPDEATLRTWAAGIFRRNGRQISGSALALFLEYTGEDMQNISGEAEKLICYSMGKREITQADIKAVCSPRIKDRIFDMISAIASHDQRKALTIYMDLCSLRTPPQVILTLMRRQFRQLLQVRELTGKMPDAEIARAIGVPPFVVSKRYRPALRLYQREVLTEALEDCVKADYDSKSGRIDAGLAVEMIIIRYSASPAQKK